MLKRFIHYYKPHKKMLAMDMLASLLISVIGMVYPIVTNKMLNIYIPEKMYTTIVIAGLIVLVLYIVRMLLRYFVQYYGHLIGVQMQSQMRQDLFAHLEKQPFSFYDNHLPVSDRPHPDTDHLCLRTGSGGGYSVFPQGHEPGL